jgi:hypothetical protein
MHRALIKFAHAGHYPPNMPAIGTLSFGFASRLRPLAACAFVASSLACAAAAAADPASDPAPSARSNDARPVVVIVHADAQELSASRVRDAVAAEIGAPALAPDDPASAGARGTLTVTLHADTRELAVTYYDEVRGTVSRVIPAPDKPGDAPGAAALLAGNLIRNEAQDLLGPPQPAAPPPPAPAPAPPAPPEALANAGVFYPLAVNYGHPDLRTHFDLNLIYGRIGALDGLEIGTVSVVGGDVAGAQIALGANVAQGHAEGLQLALAFNDAAETTGVQAGAINVGGDATGAQIGLVNIARHVKGLQLGLFNYADDVDGIPVGLVSVTRTGGVHPTAWASNTSYANVGLKFATKYTYTMLSGSWQPDNGHDLFGPGFTLGVHVPVMTRLSANFDLGATHLFGGKLCCGDGSALRQNDLTLAKLRAMINVSLAEHLSLYAGAGVTATVRYPLDAGGQTSATAHLGPEYFGGVEF